MKIVGVIPARYKSSRFPGKPLVLINSKPMIIHVAEKVEKALGRENTYIATDDEEISRLVNSFGYKVVMTSESCKTGTDRIWEFAQIIKADIYVNIQGDEPMISSIDIINIVSEKKRNMNFVINGMFPIQKDENPNDINIPKVVVNKNNDLVYISRLPIPGVKDYSLSKPNYFKQVCIYAFTYDELKIFGENDKKSLFEQYEDIEILRFFDFNVPVRMVLTTNDTIAVDRPEDVKKVETALNTMSNES